MSNLPGQFAQSISVDFSKAFHREIQQTMTPGHPLWGEFVERLEGPEGCDFRENENGKTVWSCGGGTNQDKSKLILDSMDEVSTEKSLDYFTNHGGHCDCEVLFNVTSQ